MLCVVDDDEDEGDDGDDNDNDDVDAKNGAHSYNRTKLWVCACVCEYISYTNFDIMIIRLFFLSSNDNHPLLELL